MSGSKYLSIFLTLQYTLKAFNQHDFCFPFQSDFNQTLQQSWLMTDNQKNCETFVFLYQPRISKILISKPSIKVDNANSFMLNLKDLRSSQKNFLKTSKNVWVQGKCITFQFEKICFLWRNTSNVSELVSLKYSVRLGGGRKNSRYKSYTSNKIKDQGWQSAGVS